MSFTDLQIADAQKVASDKAEGYNNLLIAQVSSIINNFNKITEQDKVLNPQQVADGFQLRKPGQGSEIYYNIGNCLKLLAWAKSGILDPEYWLKREWLVTVNGELVATQVPWSPVSNTGLQIYATKELALAKAAEMLNQWHIDNTIPAVVGQPAVFGPDGVTVVIPAVEAKDAVVPKSPVGFLPGELPEAPVLPPPGPLSSI